MVHLFILQLSAQQYLVAIFIVQVVASATATAQLSLARSLPPPRHSPPLLSPPPPPFPSLSPVLPADGPHFPPSVFVRARYALTAGLPAATARAAPRSGRPGARLRRGGIPATINLAPPAGSSSELRGEIIGLPPRPPKPTPASAAAHAWQPRRASGAERTPNTRHRAQRAPRQALFALPRHEPTLGHRAGEVIHPPPGGADGWTRTAGGAATRRPSASTAGPVAVCGTLALPPLPRPHG